jgi:ABC-type glutathione transport system ATPase component
VSTIRSSLAPAGGEGRGEGARARIVFDHVSMEYPSKQGRLRVVDNVSYAIADGEFVAVIGPSGCGRRR